MGRKVELTAKSALYTRIYQSLIFLCFSVTLGASVFGSEKPSSGPSVDFSHGDLKISQNRRFLVHSDGTPFFYLGDTAWELFHRLNREEAELYLENRRQKGFTVIQAVALAELDGLKIPNAYGHRPLLKIHGQWDPAKPDIRDGENNDYWDHVDWIIDKAAEKGIYIGLLPTWGDKVDSQRWGKGPEIFNPKNAEIYGKWIANRYKNRPNIIWINGGDRSGGGNNFPVWNALGEAIKSVDSRHPVTFHPAGGHNSSEWFHNKKWLDFNMLQSGHGEWDIANYKAIEHDYNLKPTKPCIDGEPRYEDHPVSWNPKRGWFDERDVRQACYWAVFAGGIGVTYGCHDIWQMFDKGREPISSARNLWYEVLDLPGAWDMLHLRRLMESRPMLSRVPDQSLILEGQTDGADHIQATRGNDYAFVYIPYGQKFKIASGRISGKTVKAWWYSPRSGKASLIGEFENSGTREFDPPGEAFKGNDWVLVLDDASKEYAAPGSEQTML